MREVPSGRGVARRTKELSAVSAPHPAVNIGPNIFPISLREGKRRLANYCMGEVLL